jgi:hypothetical protein
MVLWKTQSHSEKIHKGSEFPNTEKTKTLHIWKVFKRLILKSKRIQITFCISDYQSPNVCQHPVRKADLYFWWWYTFAQSSKRQYENICKHYKSIYTLPAPSPPKKNHTLGNLSFSYSSNVALSIVTYNQNNPNANKQKTS